MLKHTLFFMLNDTQIQPPLGGCVLKQVIQTTLTKATGPAAFRRLCVETSNLGSINGGSLASRL